MTLFVNGRIHTLDPRRPRATWLLVQSGRCVEVGSGHVEVPDGTPRFDLQQHVVVPGFHDAHVHLTWIALSLLGPDLTHAAGVQEAMDGMATWTGPGRGPQGAWIVGDGIDESTWPERRLPTRVDLDAAVADRPALVKRVCGHVGVLNSRALAECPRGKFTDAGTGHIAEEDLWALNDRLRPDYSTFMRVWPQVRERLLSHGITSVHDVASIELVEALERTQLEQDLGVRVSYSLPVRDPAGLQDMRRYPDDPWLRCLGIKVFADGSLGARTAWLRQPYTDQSDARGEPLHEPRELAQLLRAGHERGLQLMVHAIGDAALTGVVEALQPLCAGGNPMQHRIEHVEITPPDLVRQVADSGVWACVQPNFAGRWSQPGGMNEQRLGPERMPHCNAYRTLHDAGVPLAFGSDCMPLGPLFGLESAVHHPDVRQRLDPATALDLYTRAPATLGFADDRSGALAPGHRADFTVLDCDPLSEAGVAAGRVLATVVDGVVAWCHSEAPWRAVPPEAS